MREVYQYYIDLPNSIKEMVTPNVDDDGYTVYINSRLTREQALKAYQHALRHVNSNDFEKDDVQNIERDAHER